jgi:hypothetical protein
VTSAASARVFRRVTRRTARALAAALMAYGIFGALIVSALAVAAAPASATLDALARSSADVQLTLTATRDAFEGFGVSLVEARLSAQRAATTARSTAATAKQLADAMGLSVFGVRPLLPLAAGFERQSTDLEALATELDALAVALQRDERDVRTLTERVGVLSERAGWLAATSPPAVPIAAILYALLLWMGLQSAGAFWAGAALWRTEADQ